MPFETLDTFKGRTRDRLVSISYKRKMNRHFKEKQPAQFIGIPRGVAAGFTPHKSGSYEFQRGTGTDAGKGRIAPAKNGNGSPLVGMRGGYTIRFGYMPYLGLSAAETEHVEARVIDGNTIEIDLPPWFKPDEETS